MSNHSVGLLPGTICIHVGGLVLEIIKETSNLEFENTYKCKVLANSQYPSSEDSNFVPKLENYYGNYSLGHQGVWVLPSESTKYWTFTRTEQ